MAEWRPVVLLLLSILFCFEAHSGFLDFEELASVNYGIDIIDKPVMVGQEPPGAILLRSKYGQQYQCSYVDRVAEDERERQEQQEAIDTGIPELLKPMATASCLVYPKDWWTYEFCYGKHVKQYHIEDNKIVGNVIYLGHFESEFDWNNITEKDKKRKYHSHRYTNGTLCDLTNKPRQVEVRFECEEGEVDTVYEISEAQTCVYTLLVHTARLCKHPYLKKAAPAKPVPITCNPLVSAEQYQEYLHTLEENMRREEEENARKTCKLISTKEDGGNYLKTYKMIDDSSQTDSDTPNSNAEESVTDINLRQPTHSEDEVLETNKEDPTSLSPEESQPKSTQSEKEVSPVKKILRDMLAAGSKESSTKKDGKTEVRAFTDVSKLQQYIQEIVGNRKVNVKVTRGPRRSQNKEQVEGQGDQSPEGQPQGHGDNNLGDQTEGQPQGQDESMTEGHHQGQPEGRHQGQPEGRLQGQPEGQPEGPTEEEESEEATEGDTEAKEDSVQTSNTDALREDVEQDDDEKIMAEFDKELNEIVDTAEKKAHMSMYKDNIESAMQSKFSDIVEEAEQELANEGTDAPVDKQQAFSDLAKTLTKLLSRLQRTEREKRAVEKHLKKAQLLATAAKIRQQNKGPPPTTEQVDTPQTTPTKQDTNTDPAPTEKQPENDVSADATSSNDVTTSTDDVTTDDVDADADGSSLTQLHSLNNRVRVRVTRLKRAPPGGGTENGGKTGDGADDKQTLQIPDEQRKELETTVKSELEKAGLETKGQKIEVKIITAGYFNTNKEGVHVLSEEESSAFNNMIVSILGGNSQAAKEMSRQKNMEDAYTHVWGKSKKRKTSSTETTLPPAAPPS